MELFVDLPQTLFNSYNKPIQLHIYHRLAFLWKTSYEVMKDSPILSHQLSLNFYTLASQSDVELPDHINLRLCKHCHAIVLPSINCQVKVKSKPRYNQIKRILKDENDNESPGKKLKNILVKTCQICQQKSYQPCCYKTVKSKCSESKSELEQSFSKASKTNTSTGCKKYSFHDILKNESSRRSSAPSRLEGDFIPLLSSPVPYRSHKKDILSSFQPKVSNPVSTPVKVDLFELERSMKKNKRKRSGEVFPAPFGTGSQSAADTSKLKRDESSASDSNNPTNSNLASIQNLFKRN